MAGPRTDPTEDARLIEAVVAGSEDALATLYDRHAGAVYATAVRSIADRGVAEDIVQETFLALWNRAEQFDPTRGSLAAWLFTIARNRAVDRLRAAGRRPGVVSISAARIGDETDAATFERMARSGEVVGAASPERGPEGELAGVELRAELQEALATMVEPERQVLLLAYRDELTQREIADRLGWPLGTVKTRTRRALLRLRTVLGPGYAPVAGPGLDPPGAPESPAGSNGTSAMMDRDPGSSVRVES
jgi:RNA polymerase sigma-70 factor (ECF subfamily)